RFRRRTGIPPYAATRSANASAVAPGQLKSSEPHNRRCLVWSRGRAGQPEAALEWPPGQGKNLLRLSICNARHIEEAHAPKLCLGLPPGCPARERIGEGR